MKQYFKDLCGNTASITMKGTESYTLICRDYYGRQWKKDTYKTAKGAKIALGRTGGSWYTTSGYVE